MRCRLLKARSLGLGALLLLIVFDCLPLWADPLTPPEVAALTTRLLDGKVWLVHAVIVRVIDGDTVVVHMDLGWHTWRHDEHVRLNGIDAPERTDPARWAEGKAFVERLLPAGTEVLLVSEKLEKYGRTLGRILLRDGHESRYLLTGLGGCGACGGGLTVHSRAWGTGRQHTYVCGHYHRKGTTVCTNRRVLPMVATNAEVLRSIEQTCLSPLAVERIVEGALAALTAPQEALASREVALRATLNN